MSKKNTREKLLAVAETLFADKGFYGTSINDVAKEVAVSKQALLHHFPSKEKLYAAVLQRAADSVLDYVHQASKLADAPNVQLAVVIEQMGDAQQRPLQVVMLLLRELIDNRERVETANQWFMRPFLDALVALVEKAQKQGFYRGKHPLAFVYQLLGASQYYLVSLPTLEQLYSSEEFRNHQQHHQQMLAQWLEVDGSAI